MNNLEWVGWAASALLIATLVQQIITQWRAKETQGVSVWLFLGQIGASVGFVIYSVSVRNWVFVITNSLILLTAAVGQILYWRSRSKEE